MEAMNVTILIMSTYLAAQCDQNGAVSLTSDERIRAIDNHSQ
jgi:hypothetical protein